MIKVLLLFLLAVLLFVIVVGGVVLSFLYHRFRGFFRMFKGRQDDNSSSGAFSSGAYSSESRSGQGNRRTTVGDAGETVIDTRDPREANRKIIPRDEGEYVDFVEQK